jgi:hypothetical protein
MPSDDPRVRLALEALARPIAEFRSAITGALVQAETALAVANSDTNTRRARARAELGAFAEGRIAPDAFAALADPVPVVDPASRAALARAVDVLLAVTGRGEELFLADVPPNGSLGRVVGAALAEAGRAFGALVLAELARGGRYRAADHDRLLDPLAFRDWNRAERRFAPPLVVSLDGADLQAGALADFCDGRAKLVLVVRGPCAPAALVRLITPGTLVLQTMDRVGLDRIVAHEGPSVAALVPEEAARFLHDPSGGREPWQRLGIAHLPEAPGRALGGLSTWQMAEDLQQLATLARTPFAIPAPGAGEGTPALGGAEAVERLAAWLLSRSDPSAA